MFKFWKRFARLGGECLFHEITSLIFKGGADPSSSGQSPCCLLHLWYCWWLKAWKSVCQLQQSGHKVIFLPNCWKVFVAFGSRQVRPKLRLNWCKDIGQTKILFLFDFSDSSVSSPVLLFTRRIPAIIFKLLMLWIKSSCLILEELWKTGITFR